MILGDALHELKALDANSIDAVITDPPYGLAFMNKHWDYEVPSIDIWREVFRVMKPGGHLLSFGGTRTYHRMVVNIEDAGFEIRDQVQWIYGQGFPKSLNISIAIDKAAGAMGARGKGFNAAGQNIGLNQNKELRSDHPDYIPPKAVTPEAAKWEGWGTALKPANEPIVLARKPLSEKTVAANVLKWGTGGLNIDATRIGTEAIQSNAYRSKGKEGCMSLPGEASQSGNIYDSKTHTGRFPANVIFDEVAGKLLDAQTGDLSSGSRKAGVRRGLGYHGASGDGGPEITGDSGGASRFFYCAKASKSERNRGLEGIPSRRGGAEQFDSRWKEGSGELRCPENQNHHPTVKPVALMEYLVKLITPPNGIVLDPFMGSGTTGVACKRLGFNFTGIELNDEYFEIAKRRIEAAAFVPPVESAQLEIPT